jgi:hypothetical protein
LYENKIIHQPIEIRPEFFMSEREIAQEKHKKEEIEQEMKKKKKSKKLKKRKDPSQLTQSVTNTVSTINNMEASREEPS